MVKDYIYKMMAGLHCKQAFHQLRLLEKKLVSAQARFALPFVYRGKGYFKTIEPRQNPLEIEELYKTVMLQQGFWKSEPPEEVRFIYGHKLRKQTPRLLASICLKANSAELILPAVFPFTKRSHCPDKNFICLEKIPTKIKLLRW